ncbi:hypothetical protein P3T76_004385 [Phytophthora citrophthora]|uniref:Uncharacterized protein n=1 Tax=Phytophthora citrophthora TaxID=4793 RepID=A0AAD9GUH0_9STRA|nr:hypothetical protein P3T76_004385 [Phytophthora citrophthora]
MSREERKMAQIIASIERMEQETRDDSGRSQEPQDAAKRGKKGKKGKYSGLKAKGGKKFKVASVAIGPGGAKAPFERKLTPKKRWIQLWSAQLDTIKEDGSSSSSEGPEGPAENEEEHTEKQDDVNMSAVASSPVSPVSQAKVTPVASPTPAAVVTTTKIQEQPVGAIPIPVTQKQKVEEETPALAHVAVLQTKPQEQVTETPKTATTPKLTTPKATTSKVATNTKVAKVSSSELRVKTPLNNESSHLSPPLERNSPTTTASISPSAKVKDSDTPNNNASAAKFSPAATEQEKPIVTERKELSRNDSAPQLERKISSSSSSSMGKSEDGNRRDTPGRLHDRGRKRSLEQCELPMSEEAKRRAERRRKRKSNWDVGDPRRGGSPVTDPPVSAAAAAANQQSFAKYPPNRPWRHSQSMMDIKPHFQSVHRSSSFYNSGSSSGSRRGFYHSTSLPQDRSRSAGRSSTRYNFGNSSSGGGGSGGSSYR